MSSEIERRLRYKRAEFIEVCQFLQDQLSAAISNLEKGRHLNRLGILQRAGQDVERLAAEIELLREIVEEMETDV